MSERETRVRTAIVVYFPMFIAALSLFTSIYNGYLNSRFVDFIQHILRALNRCAPARNSGSARGGAIQGEASQPSWRAVAQG